MRGDEEEGQEESTEEEEQKKRRKRRSTHTDRQTDRQTDGWRGEWLHTNQSEESSCRLCAAQWGCLKLMTETEAGF